MDKRIAKSKRAIYQALVEELKSKSYDDIKVEDILRSSGVSRSTFYSHFQGKEDVLDSLLDTIFAHVFSSSLSEESTHDFSHASIFDYSHLFTHLFYHLRDERDLLSAIISSSGKSLFCEKMRVKSAPLIEKSFDAQLFGSASLPKDLALIRAKESFVTIILYWFGTNLADSPETMTNYFIAMNR